VEIRFTTQSPIEEKFDRSTSSFVLQIYASIYIITSLSKCKHPILGGRFSIMFTYTLPFPVLDNQSFSFFINGYLELLPSLPLE